LTAIINLITIYYVKQIEDKIAPSGITVLPVFLFVLSAVVLFIALVGLPLKPPTYGGQSKLFDKQSKQ
jgi:hypothetical protein